MFVTGLSLFVFAGLYASLADEKVYTLVFAGLGASTFVACSFWARSTTRRSRCPTSSRAKWGFLAFFEQIRMWASYPWDSDGRLDAAKAEKASQMLHERAKEAMADLQRYVEPRGRERRTSPK